MATRATYQIGNMVFYCHWDGYPTGAAVRFANMVKALTVPNTGEDIRSIEDRRGGMAYAFIRGNMDAEPTLNHDAHGDTEYRYTLNCDKAGLATIRVSQRSGDWSEPEWKIIAVEGLADWLNRMRGETVEMLERARARRAPKKNRPLLPEPTPLAEALEAIPVIVMVGRPRYDGVTSDIGYTYATLDAAKAIKAREAKLAAQYRLTVEGHPNPNHTDHLARMRSWAQAVRDAEILFNLDRTIADAELV